MPDVEFWIYCDFCHKCTVVCVNYFPHHQPWICTSALNVSQFNGVILMFSLTCVIIIV